MGDLLRPVRTLHGWADHALHSRPAHGHGRRPDRRAWGGLYSDLVQVPYAGAMLVPLPEELDPVAMASAIDNWPLAYRLVAPHLKGKPGARVLMAARGSIGLYVCDIARALGASDVLYVDLDPAAHRRIAESFGAHTTEEVEPIPHGFDLAVESTGRVDPLALALRCLTPEGFCEQPLPPR
jgi:threonine dehydrogenase-like Zn-dependent dehydrogenase